MPGLRGPRERVGSYKYYSWRPRKADLLLGSTWGSGFTRQRLGPIYFSPHPFIRISHYQNTHTPKLYQFSQIPLSIHTSLAHNPCLVLHFQKTSLLGPQSGLPLASYGLVRPGPSPDTKMTTLTPTFKLTLVLSFQCAPPLCLSKPFLNFKPIHSGNPLPT